MSAGGGILMRAHELRKSYGHDEALVRAVTVSGIVAVLFAHATVAVGEFGGSASRANFDRFDVGFISQTARIDSVLTVVAVMLVVLAVANVVFIVRSTIQDNRRSSAITRALGATPEQLAASVSLAQIVPSFLRALVGIAGGYGMFTVANGGGSIAVPPAWALLLAFAGSVVAVAGITAERAENGRSSTVCQKRHVTGSSRLYDAHGWPGSQSAS